MERLKKQSVIDSFTHLVLSDSDYSHTHPDETWLQLPESDRTITLYFPEYEIAESDKEYNKHFRNSLNAIFSLSDSWYLFPRNSFNSTKILNTELEKEVVKVSKEEKAQVIEDLIEFTGTELNFLVDIYIYNEEQNILFLWYNHYDEMVEIDLLNKQISANLLLKLNETECAFEFGSY